MFSEKEKFQEAIYKDIIDELLNMLEQEHMGMRNEAIKILSKNRFKKEILSKLMLISIGILC